MRSKTEIPTNASLLSCPIVSSWAHRSWWRWRRNEQQHQRTRPPGMLVHPATSELNTQPVFKKNIYINIYFIYICSHPALLTIAFFLILDLHPFIIIVVALIISSFLYFFSCTSPSSPIYISVRFLYKCKKLFFSVHMNSEKIFNIFFFNL